MNFSMLSLFLLLFIAATTLASDVIVLDTSNFEHLTQASTGATTGDWLVKFYAPWCGHCKKLEPTWEQVAEELKGEVNVAKVDVTGSRDLGTRFEIKGFPTLKMLSKGKVYDYKGRRSPDAIIEFARGGFQTQQAVEVSAPLGMFGEVKYVYMQAYKQASKDLQAKNFFTMDVFLTFMPALFVLMMLLLLCTPVAAPSSIPKKRSTKSSSAAGAAPAAAPSSATDSSHTKND